MLRPPAVIPDDIQTLLERIPEGDPYASESDLA